MDMTRWSNKIRLTIFFAAKDQEVLYIQKTHDLDLTVAQIMNFLLQNSDLYSRKEQKTLDHLVCPKSNPL